MTIVNGLLPIKNPRLLSSIIRLFSSQMALLCMSSCMIKRKRITQDTSDSECMCTDGACILDVESVSPFLRRLCHCWSSRSPTQSGPPHLSRTPHAVGRTAGQRAGLLSAGSRPAGLQGHLLNIF